MAEKHSTRRMAGSSARPPDARKRREKRRTSPRKSPPNATSSTRSSKRSPTRPSTAEHAAKNPALASRLRDVARLLSVAYSTCVTAELALKGQNADQDYEILAALRMNVTEPVSRLVERLNSIAQTIDGGTREARP